MRTILSGGLRIPQDIAVVGFDDIEDARYAFPSLTTISPDKESIARLAVARLFDRMKGDEAPPASRSVDYRLVVRESTGGTAGVRLEAVAGGGFVLLLRRVRGPADDVEAGRGQLRRLAVQP